MSRGNRLLAVAVALTAFSIVLHWLTPANGFLRGFYPSGNFTAPAASLEAATDIGLAFIAENPSLPPQGFGVQWRGYWHVTEDRTIALEVTSGDEVLVQIDSRVVIERRPRQLPRKTLRQVTLAKGDHEILVRYRQRGSGMGVAVRAGLPGGVLADLPPAEIFRSPNGPHSWAIAAAMPWMNGMVVAAWIVALTVLARDPIARALRGRLAVATPAVVASRIKVILAPALLGPTILFLATPLTVHIANRDEFMVAFTDIVWPWVVGAVVASWIVLVATGALLAAVSERATRIYTVVLVVTGVLLWLQGTLLVADYGVLYGEALDLNQYARRTPYELALWGGALLVGIKFARQISRVASLLSVTFVALQVGAAAITLSSAAQTRSSESRVWRDPPRQIYALSSTTNVIHIVLDAYLSELFGEAVVDDRAFFDRTFSGFVYFADHLGAFPTTRASMPAMLTGEVYRNGQPFQQFIERTLQRRSIATVLAEHGFLIRSVSFRDAEHPLLSPGPSALGYTIPTPFGSYPDYVRFAALQLFDFAMFRCVPHLLKPLVYREEGWLWQRLPIAGGLGSQRARTATASNHAAFFDDMSNRLGVGAAQPVYLFIHVAIPHPPVVLDGACVPIPRVRTSRSAYAGQSRCAIAIVGRFLDRLRSLGVYDRSVVVLTSDHGWRVPRRGDPLASVQTPAGDLQQVALSAMPLLAVKPIGVSGPLRTSSAPTHITDVPATIADLVGLPPGLFPGQPALRIAPDAPRDRHFAHHSWREADWAREYLNSIQVFSVRGPIHRPSSWRFEETIIDPTETRR